MMENIQLESVPSFRARSKLSEIVPSAICYVIFIPWVVRALASGLSYAQVDKHAITILYHYISVDLAHHEIFCAKDGKDGKGGIN